jgi:hypothetical protein
MARIERHFQSLQDPRFDVIRVYDLLSKPRAIVMELAGDPSLSALLIKRWWQPPFLRANLNGVFYNAGAWLQAYHRLSGLAHTQTRHATRQDFSAAVEQLISFLMLDRTSTEFLVWVRESMMASADRFLMPDLPLGMVHGDYAPRNILVGAGGRIRVLDTLARWRAPIFEDIAQFLVGLKAHRLQVYTHGLFLSAPRLWRYEDCFLTGYFADAPVPLASVRLFECLALLEKWCAIIHHYSPKSAATGLGKRCVAAVWVRYLRTTVNRLVQGLHRLEPSRSQKRPIRPVA